MQCKYCRSNLTDKNLVPDTPHFATQWLCPSCNKVTTEYQPLFDNQKQIQAISKYGIRSVDMTRSGDIDVELTTINVSRQSWLADPIKRLKRHLRNMKYGEFVYLPRELGFGYVERIAKHVSTGGKLSEGAGFHIVLSGAYNKKITSDHLDASTHNRIIDAVIQCVEQEGHVVPTNQLSFQSFLV